MRLRDAIRRLVPLLMSLLLVGGTWPSLAVTTEVAAGAPAAALGRCCACARAHTGMRPACCTARPAAPLPSLPAELPGFDPGRASVDAASVPPSAPTLSSWMPGPVGPVPPPAPSDAFPGVPLFSRNCALLL